MPLQGPTTGAAAHGSAGTDTLIIQLKYHFAKVFTPFKLLFYRNMTKTKQKKLEDVEIRFKLHCNL